VNDAEEDAEEDVEEDTEDDKENSTLARSVSPEKETARTGRVGGPGQDVNGLRHRQHYGVEAARDDSPPLSRR
jgi:hypothetical protein